jgi:hypothetical protein
MVLVESVAAVLIVVGRQSFWAVPGIVNVVSSPPMSFNV